MTDKEIWSPEKKADYLKERKYFKKYLKKSADEIDTLMEDLELSRRQCAAHIEAMVSHTQPNGKIIINLGDACGEVNVRVARIKSDIYAIVKKLMELRSKYYISDTSKYLDVGGVADVKQFAGSRTYDLIKTQEQITEDLNAACMRHSKAGGAIRDLDLQKAYWRLHDVSAVLELLKAEY